MRMHCLKFHACSWHLPLNVEAPYGTHNTRVVVYLISRHEDSLLESAQSDHQRTRMLSSVLLFRKGCSTADNLLSLTLLVEKCREWNEPLWIAFVDFHKAFDTVEHLPLWKTLDELGVQRSYTSILMKLYEGQLATVVARTESRAFPLKSGVKQGDPISSLLFIAVMEAIFRRLKSKWMKLNARRSGDYYGIVVDDAVSPMTNLRFADDVLLLAKSKTDIRKTRT